MADVPVRVWGYNGQMPGPELRVREGDTVRVTLRNQLPVPTTIHWHGVNVPNAMDGVAGLNQAPVEPGATFVYDFTATPAGTRWYHSHTDPALQVPIGLYGALIVEPRQPADDLRSRIHLLLAEWDTELTPAWRRGPRRVGPGDQMLRGGELGADLFLLNGQMHGAIPPLMVTDGRAGPDPADPRRRHAPPHPHPRPLVQDRRHRRQSGAGGGAADQGHRPDRTGRALRSRIGRRQPRVWMVHCHIEHHMANGMMTTIWYEGYQPTGPAADAAVAEATMAADMGPHASRRDVTPRRHRSRRDAAASRRHCQRGGGDRDGRRPL